MVKTERNKWKFFGLILALFAALLISSACEPVDDDDYDNDDDIIVIDDGDNFCLDNITNLTPGNGPFSVSRETLRVSGGNVKMWIPNVPAGCKVPIVHLANGTGGTCATYGTILRNLAEFGFVGACYESMNTGQGTQAITAVEAATQEYSSIVDPGKVGFTGHSQGGGATFMGVYRAEQKWGNSKIYSGLAMEPASGFGDAPMNYQQYYKQIKSPMSMFNGTADTLVLPFYARMSWTALPNDIFKVWYTATGADSTHIPTPNNPTREMSIPWFRWTLLGDSNACQEFKDLPNKAGWRLEDQDNVPACY